MEAAVHRFVRLLRLYGVRISVSETLDAMAAVAQPGVLGDRPLLRAALRGTLIKDRRDLETFDRVFDAYFALLPVIQQAQEHGHAHDDLSDTGEVEAFTLSDSPGDNPEQGHSHGKPDDIRDYFRPEDLAQQYNLHQEANKIDLAASTNEVVLSNQTGTLQEEAARLQLSTRRLHNPGMPGAISQKPGLELDTELSVAQEMALLGWLGEGDDPDADVGDGDPADLKRMREQLAPLLAALPESLRRHLQQLLDAGAEIERREFEASQAEHIDETERFAMESSIRRILHSLHGSPRPRRGVATRGTVDGRRTMRASMRYDGVPFRPVTVAKVADRPRLVVLVDASLSVRATARFTLHLVHSLQSLATSVRTFVFVDRVVEVTDLFSDHRIEEALSLIMSGLPAGGLIDVDADSDYGSCFAEFLEEYGSALTRRSTLMVLGDGRGNGHDPGLTAFEEMTRRARSTVWLTPEPRFSWTLGRCDLPLYSEFCDRVHVVRGLTGLEDLSNRMAVQPR